MLKPASDYGGRGVDARDWRRTRTPGTRRSRSTPSVGDFIVQEYVPIPEEMFPTIDDGNVQMRLKRFNINPYCIGGRYVGMMTRISDQAVINVAAGGGILPSVVGRHKRKLLLEENDELAE